MPFCSVIGTGSLQFHSPTTDTSVAKPLNENDVIGDAVWDDARTSFDESGEKTTRIIIKIKNRATNFIPGPPFAEVA